MSLARFAKLAFWVTFSVVLAGSIVRSTGSGMGCPDWPKCFGSWVPPTDASEVPEGYDQELVQARVEKAEDFASLLEKTGMSESAERIRSSQEIHQTHPFNTSQTWTEYVNRLVGFLAGNFALICLIWAVLRRKGWKAISLSASIVVLIGFQAWFGSIVVATNLVPWTISVHMILALVILAIQLLLVRNLRGRKIARKDSMLWGSALVVVLIQMALGLAIRQQVDPMLHEMGREHVIGNLDWTFLVHRSFSWSILALALWMFWRHRQDSRRTPAMAFLSLVVIELIAGITLYKLDLPAAAQPVHLALGMLLILLPFSRIIGTPLFWREEEGDSGSQDINSRTILAANEDALHRSDRADI